MRPIAAFLILAACGGGDTSGWRGFVDTLPNGAVVVHNASGQVWDSSSAWRLIEDLRIGTAGEGPASFSQIVAFEVDRIGRIYAIDREAQEVRVFDSNGKFVRTIGRRGKGPGEFVGANGLAWDPTSRLWVVDQQGERYTLLDTAGRVLETHVRGLGFYGWRWQGTVDTAGRIVEEGMAAAQGEGSRILLRFDRTFARKDTFPLPTLRPGVTEEYLRISYPAGYSVAPVPFSPRLAWTVLPSGQVWFGFGDEYRIFARRLSGDTMRIVERAVEPVAITDAELDSAVGALIAGISRSAGRTDIASQVDRSRIPRRKPAFVQFFVDDSGGLWVAPSVPAGEPKDVLDVFDAAGRYLGRVTLPFAHVSYQPIMIRGGRVYTITQDSDGVQYIVRARILRPREAVPKTPGG